MRNLRDLSPRRLPTGLIAALLAVAWLAPGCKGASVPMIAAAVGTSIAVGVAAHNRAHGGCYAPCQKGTICNPDTGFCDPIPCGGCEVGEYCVQTGALPKCVPVAPDEMHLFQRTVLPPSRAAQAPAGGPRAAPYPEEPSEGQQPAARDPAGCVRITHFYPAWPTPADYQPAVPLFFARFNQPVNPETVMGLARIAVDDSGWKEGRFFVRDSFLVPCPEGTCTDVFFGLELPLKPGSSVTWAVTGAYQGRLGQACPGTEQNGAYVYTVFLTHDEQHPVGSVDGFWSRAQLERTYGSEKAGALLRRQAETMEIILNYRTRQKQGDQKGDE